MGAAKKLIDKKVLRDLIPINALSATHIEEISRKAVIEDLRSGSFAFRQGDRDNQTVYLLEGQLEFVDEADNVVDSLVAGSEQACHPLAHKQPRQLGARASGKAVVARIDSSLLDVLLTWDESAGYDVVEIDAQDDGDWMTRMLQSQAFLQLPPSNIHQLLMRLEAISASAGDVIVSQGDEGDYFYIVKSGRLAVTRKASPRSREVLLAELGEGACFGEEALVSGTKRNASVMMVTDGTLMRLSKNDFNELLCASLVHEADFEGAQKLVAKGARWLDVRLPGEFDNKAIRDSINLPLSALRDQCTELERGTDYIVCCDTGRRSAAGAFVLSQQGFNVYTLKNGLMDVPEEALVARTGNTVPEPGRDADILPFDGDTRPESASVDRGSEDSGSDTTADSALIDKLASAEGDRLTLQQEVTRLETRVAELDCQFEELASNAEKDSKALKDELAAALSALSVSQQQLESGRQTGDRQIQELEQALGRLREDYQQLGQRTSAVAGERDAANRDLQEAQRQLKTLQEQLGSGEIEIQATQQRLQQVLAEQEQALAAGQSEIQNLQQRLEEAQSTRQQLEQQLEVTSELAGSGQSQVAELQTRSEEVARRQEELETDLQSASQQIADLQSALQQAETQAENRLAQQQSEAAAEAEQLNRRIEELQQQREETGAEVTAERDNLVERVAQLQQELQDLQANRAELEQVCEAAGEEKDDLARQIQQLQQALDEQQRQAQAQQSETGQLQQQLIDVQQKLEEQTALEQTLRGQLQEFEQQDQARSGQWQQQLDEGDARIEALETDLNGARQQYEDAERCNAELEARLVAQAKEHKSDLDGTRNALSRAQSETENLKREHGRLMESLRNAERNLERERQDHEGELYRLRKELKDAAGDSSASAGLAAELEALQARLQEGVRLRDDLEIKLGERSAQLEDVQAEADRLVLQLQQAQEGARQAEQQLLDSSHTANEEMTVRMEAEDKARQALREELAAAVAERNRAQEQLTVERQALDEMREAAETAQQQAASQEQSGHALLEKLRQELDEALEQLRQSQLQLDDALEQQCRSQQEIDQLRAEAEVTRGLVDMQVSGAGDAELLEELDRAKKNVDVAVRLRSQAEEKNTQLQLEIEQLRSRLQAVENHRDTPLSAGHIPSLDEEDPDAAAELNPEYKTHEPGEDAAEPPVSTRLEGRASIAGAGLTETAPVKSVGGFRSLLGGMVLGAVAAGAGSWWLLTQSSPLPDILQVGSAGAGNSTATVAVPVAGEKEAGKTSLHTTQPVSVTPETASNRSTLKQEPAPSGVDSRQTLEPVAPPADRIAQPMRIPDFIKGGSATANSSTAEPSQVAAARDPEAVASADPPVAESAPEPVVPKIVQPLRLYSESLNDGGRAPMLVEFQSDSFEMGSGASSANFDERPRHRVQLRRFAISAHEITFADYDRFARASGRALPGDNGWGRGQRPVINVSWQDAVAYTRWLSEQTGSRYRLPSEAEWEFVAHSGTDTRFWWGNEVGDGQANCFDCGSEWSGRMTAPAGSFAASAFRVYDMAGNVMEWVQDCYRPDYSAAPADGRAVSSASCDRRVVRGGAYNSPSESLRSVSRDGREADTRLDNLGFRVVKE